MRGCLQNVEAGFDLFYRRVFDDKFKTVRYDFHGDLNLNGPIRKDQKPTRNPRDFNQLENL